MTFAKLPLCVRDLNLSRYAKLVWIEFLYETWRDYPTKDNPHPKQMSLTMREMVVKFELVDKTIKKALDELVAKGVLAELPRDTTKSNRTFIMGPAAVMAKPLNNNSVVRDTTDPTQSVVRDTTDGFDSVVRDTTELEITHTNRESIYREVCESDFSPPLFSNHVSCDVDEPPAPDANLIHHEKEVNPLDPKLTDRVICEVHHVIATDRPFQSLSKESQAFVLSELKGGDFERWKLLNRTKSFNGIIGKYFKEGGAKSVIQKPKLTLVVSDTRLIEIYQQALHHRDFETAESLKQQYPEKGFLFG